MATTVGTGDVRTFDDIEERSRSEFPVLAAGLYDECYLKDWKKTTSQDGSKEYYKPEFVVKDPTVGEVHIFGYWEISPKSAPILKHELNALGVSLAGVGLDDVEEIEARMEQAKGADCKLRLRIRSYKAKDDDGNDIAKESNDIRDVLPA